mmetsp:Transcript_20921/g.31013  ORF Transcript_20921/g.31013 Transcript_20921/m.31013 type:complete len:80 (+) Transcript_20921:265-504(+)
MRVIASSDLLIDGGYNRDFVSDLRAVDSSEWLRAEGKHHASYIFYQRSRFGCSGRCAQASNEHDMGVTQQTRDYLLATS